jgi:hypothetical protein
VPGSVSSTHMSGSILAWYLKKPLRSSNSSSLRLEWISVSSKSKIISLSNPTFVNFNYILLSSGIIGNELSYFKKLILWNILKVISLYADTISDFKWNGRFQLDWSYNLCLVRLEVEETTWPWRARWSLGEYFLRRLRCDILLWNSALGTS